MTLHAKKLHLHTPHEAATHPKPKKKKTILIGYILVCISGGDYSWLQLFFLYFIKFI